MASISISGILRIRRRWRFLTILAVGLIIFVFIQLITSNPATSYATASCVGANPRICTITNNASGTLTKNAGETFSTYTGGGQTVQINEADDLVINNSTVTLSSPPGQPHVFGNLTLSNNTVLNHLALTTSDNSTSNKRVELKVTGTLSFNTGSNINVFRKGYPSSLAGTGNGLGPAFGKGLVLTSCSSTTMPGGGGAGYGGAGGAGLSNANSGGADIYPSQIDFGSAGGSIVKGPCATDYRGGAGGGFVTIDANNVTGAPNINANGDSGTYGGGGSGGYINFIVRNILQIDALGTNVVLANRGTSSSAGGSGQFGEVIWNGSEGRHIVGGTITANGGGGIRGGGGGGGVIILTIRSLMPTCNITSGTTIPAACEYGDITITNTTINADDVKIDRSSGTPVECTDSANSNCDSKRHFRNLTVGTGGVITHNELATTEVGDGDISNDTAGAGRWRKVDFEISGIFTLNNGGTIDVSGKGYPGGNSTHENGYGPGGGESNRADDGDSGVGSSGGGYGGVGGFGCDDYENGNGCTIPSDSHGGVVNGSADNPLNLGSGGGRACNTSGSTSCVDGGRGGGRVFILADSYFVELDSLGIVANGANGRTSGGSSDAFSGGGSGGTIRLSYYNDARPLLPSASNGGRRSGDGTVYVIPPGGLTDSLANAMIKSNGGTTTHPRAGGGGGGRIMVEQIIRPQVIVEKMLSPINRPTLTEPDNFNAYAVQIGDRIEIQMNVINLYNLITLRDDRLNNKRTGVDQVYCEYNVGSLTSIGCNTVGTDINGAGIGVSPQSGSNACQVNYQCTVRTP